MRAWRDSSQCAWYHWLGPFNIPLSSEQFLLSFNSTYYSLLSHFSNVITFRSFCPFLSFELRKEKNGETFPKIRPSFFYLLLIDFWPFFALIRARARLARARMRAREKFVKILMHGSGSWEYDEISKGQRDSKYRISKQNPWTNGTQTPSRSRGKGQDRKCQKL